MIQINFRRFLLLTSAGAVSVTACGSKVVPIGSDQGSSHTVNRLSIPTTAAACPNGTVHPNICCTGPGPSAACRTFDNPLQQCSAGETTFANPLWCGSTADETCADAPADSTTGPAQQFCSALDTWWITSQTGNNTSVFADVLCGCTERHNDHALRVNCDDTSTTCTCRVDGVITRKVPAMMGDMACPSGGTQIESSALAAVWTDCAFPN